jgi:hypothetical protein
LDWPAPEPRYPPSTKLAEVAAVIGAHPIAIPLRYLQTLLEISGTKHNPTTILPVPDPAGATPHMASSRRQGLPDQMQ